MTTETLRTDKPREILALVNYQLGFCPTESLVVVSLRGPRSRAGLIARIDLAAAETAAGSLARHLAADKASSAAILVYTSDADLAHDGALFVADAVRRAGIATVGTWWVTDTDYRRIEPLSPRKCPAAGQPLNLDTTVIAAAMTRNGATVRPTRAALGVTPANEEDRDEATTAQAAWHQAMTTDTQPRQTARDMWQDTLSGTACTPTRAGRLAAALTDVVVRDAVLCSLIPGGAQIVDSILTDDADDTAVSDALSRVLDPTTGVRPNPATTDPARDLLAFIAAHTDSPAALTLLAFIAWWNGDGATANVHIDAAQAKDPDYRLADLLRSALDVGLPPGWARATR
jgi:hypothetical protein